MTSSLAAVVLAACTGGVAPAPTGAPSPDATPGPTTPASPSGSPIHRPALDLPAQGLIAIDVAHDADGETSTIAVLEPNGTGYRELTSTADGRSADPSWSTAGLPIVYFDVDGGSESHIFSIGVGGNGREQVTFGTVHDYDPVMAPDGHSIAFDRSSGGAPAAIHILDLVSGHIRQVTTPSATSKDGDLYPDWSPDGRKIAYEEEGAIFVVDVGQTSAGSPIQIVPASANAHRPRWSPDGEWLLYGNPDDAPGSHVVHLVGATGGDPRDLTGSDVFATAPTWSPDGAWIAYVVRNPVARDLELWIVRADGSVATVGWHSTPGVDMFPGHPSWGTVP